MQKTVKFALITDSCPTFPGAPGLMAVTLIVLSPYTTCITQTMEKGVIQ